MKKTNARTAIAISPNTRQKMVKPIDFTKAKIAVNYVTLQIVDTVRIKIVSLIFLSIFFSCSNKRQYTKKPAKSIVNPNSELVEVRAVAYHVHDSATLLFIEVMNENLMYRRPDTSAAFYGEIRVSYKLFSEQNSKQIIDSSSYMLIDRAGEQMDIHSLRTMFTLRTKTGSDYHAEVKVYDLNKKVVYDRDVSIHRKNLSGQDYLVNVSNSVSFDHHFKKGDTVSIETKIPVKKVRIDCFFREFPPAYPPFSNKSVDEMKYKPDSTFDVTITSGNLSIEMPAKGFYHIRSDENRNEGLTLFTFGNSFPGISNSDEMIKATRYLMNKEEYDDCMNAADQKAAIDRFWLTIGGSNERAKELLKKYYGRVMEANKLYSNYAPGWKSDRGMIYIVLGKPNYLYRGSKTETWVYGQETNPNTFRYVFTKTNNPFSENDYILERSQFFKDHWYQAVDTWRQGHVYLNQDK